MDFDDLDEATERALEAGQTVIGHTVQNNQPRLGDVLPLITRTNKLPSSSELPEAARKRIPPWSGSSVKVREPIIRLLCVHGVADSLHQDWYMFAENAPLNIEVAVHEFPGHGHRETEPIASGLDELADDCFEAFKEAMDTGSFALLGHSIGCLIVTKVAKRAREQLGVEPVVVFMVERGAPSHCLFSAEGYKQLHDDPVAFCDIFNPIVASFAKSGNHRTLDMWQKGWFCENQTLDVGYHAFKCPLWAIPAQGSIRCYAKFEELPAQLQRQVSNGGKRFNANTPDADGNIFVGHFPYDTFEDWVHWTENKDQFKIVEIENVDHMSIKADRHFEVLVFDRALEAIKRWS